MFILALCTWPNPSITSLANNALASYSHPSITISRAQHDESTSNLTCHIWNCAPMNLTQTCALAVYASGSKYTKASHWMKLVLWVSSCHHPFTIVEDTELLNIFMDLNPNCETSSCHTLSRDVKEIFSLTCGEMGTMLQVSLFHHFLQKNYLTISCRSTLGGFILLLMDGLHQMCSSELLSIGSLMARWCQLFLTSSSELLFIPIISF